MATDLAPRGRVRPVAVSLVVVLAAFVLGNGLVLTVAAVLGAFGIAIIDRPTLLLALSVVMLQGVGFGITALAYLRWRGRGLAFIAARVPTVRDWGWIVGGFVLLLGLLAAAQAALSALSIDIAQNQVVAFGERDPTVFLVLIPLSFLLVGPGEELLFRGLVQGTLQEAFHPWRAILLASGIFAVVHVFSLSGQGQLVYLAIVFVLSLLLGAAYEYTENLVVPVLIHGAYNAAQFAGAYVAATGGL